MLIKNINEIFVSNNVGVLVVHGNAHALRFAVKDVDQSTLQWRTSVHQQSALLRC